MNQNEFDDRFDGVLFVTTQVARDRMSAADQFGAPDQFIELGNLAGRYFVTIATPADVFDAISSVRTARANLRNVKGVVLLGNFAELPPANIQIACNEVNGEACADMDGWRVETDDCYGGNLVRGGEPISADVPVSRLPIVPTNGGLLGLPSMKNPNSATSLGIRASEFGFADSVFANLPNSSAFGMKISPPLEVCRPVLQDGCLPDGGLEATYHYLVLHGSDGASQGFSGSTSVAVNQSVVFGGSYGGNTLFCGACWGGLIAKLRNDESAPFDFTESLGLIFVDQGANAFVGFTGSHWIPKDSQEGLYNERLHRSFWGYTIDENEPPARALFRARRESLRHLATMSNPDVKEYAAVLKGFWSATCLGLGW